MPKEVRRLVSVVDSVPTFRLGLETALEAADFEVVRTDDVRSWSRTIKDAVVSVTMRSPTDAQLLQDLHSEMPQMRIVAVLPTSYQAAFREAILMGAHVAVAWDSQTEEIVSVIEAASRSRSLLPSDVLRALIVGAESKLRFSDEERQWLDQLAHGTRVTELANRAGYSERGMHRLLQRLYVRLGADSRSEAMVKAVQLGLLR